MTLLRRAFITSLLALGLFAVIPGGPALALDLEQAKAAGLVGERADGLLGAVPSAPAPEIRALIDRINGDRMAEYRRIAQQNNTSPQAVMAIAGSKLIDRAPDGQFVNPGDGWVRK